MIAEVFFVSWDFFALGIAAFITSFIFKFFWGYFEWYNLYLISSLIFVISAVVAWFVTKYFVKKLDRKKYVKTFSNEEIVWQHLIVQQINWEKVCYYNGIYWPIANADEVEPNTQVEVVKFENNKIWVKKI